MYLRIMNLRILALLLGLLLSGQLSAQTVSPAWQTRFELSKGLETSGYSECLTYCRRLDGSSDLIEYRSFGTSSEGRELPLLLFGGNDESKPLVFILAGIHSGEIDGKEAGLMVLRDLVQTQKYRAAKENLRIAFVPIFNVDGHERKGEFHRINQIGPKEQGRRITAQNLDLNRDWLKADAPEMRAMIKLIDELDPDFLIDIHVTDGAEYEYVITWGLGTEVNEAPSVLDYSTNSYLPEITKRMAKRGYDFVPYVIFKNYSDPKSGWTREVYPPRYSTGFGTVIGRPFVLIETHSRKPFVERVEATKVFLEETLDQLAQDKSDLLKMSSLADIQIQTLADTLRANGKSYPLDFEVANDTTWVDFKGHKSEVRYSEIAGDSVHYWTQEPEETKMATLWSNRVKSSVVPPLAYVIPLPYYLKVKGVLAAHQIPVMEFDTTLTIMVEANYLDSVTFAKAPYEGRFRINYKTLPPVLQEWRIPKGSAFVPLNHRKALRVMHLLEAKGPDSFCKWGFFPQIFEQKEGGDGDILDTLARSLIKTDTLATAEFWNKVKTDSVFAKSSSERLNYWYKHSPYWDERTNLYPIGRIIHKDHFRLAAKACGIQL